VVENDKPTTTISESVVVQKRQIDVGTTIKPTEAIVPTQLVEEAIIPHATLNSPEPKKQKEILFEENFSKPEAGYKGERVEIENNFVLKMQPHASTNRFSITQGTPASSRTIAFLITSDTNVSFRLNPGSSVRIGVHCFTESKKNYYISVKVTPNLWMSYSLSFSKMADEASRSNAIGEKFHELMFVVYDVKLDTYIDDIVIWNDIPASK
jgi:hypothetical protein